MIKAIKDTTSNIKIVNQGKKNLKNKQVKHDTHAKQSGFIFEMRKYAPNATYLNLIVGSITFVAVFYYSTLFIAYIAYPFVSARLSLVGSGHQDERPVVVPPLDVKEIEESLPEIQTVTVQPGDSLWKIAEKYCGTNKKLDVLAKNNNIDPNKNLEKGMELKVLCD